MNALLTEYKKTLAALIVAGSLAGLAYAADSRWVLKTDFQQWLSEERERETLETIRTLEIEINALEAEIEWTDDPRKNAALEERIRFLEAQIADLERRL